MTRKHKTQISHDDTQAKTNEYSYGGRRRRASTAVLVAVLVGVAAVLVGLVGPVGVETAAAQDDGVNMSADEFERDRPPQRIRSVSGDAYISSHEWVEGAVELTIVARSDGVEVVVSDGMAEWDPEASGYTESFNLREGPNDIRVEGAGTLSPEGAGQEYYGVLVEDTRAGSKGAAAGVVGGTFDPPLPDAGTTFWVTVLTVTGFASVGSYVVMRRRDDEADISDLKVRRW